MVKFKVGDIVVGTNDSPYSITGAGVECVVKCLNGDDITVCVNGGDKTTFEVSPKYFIHKSLRSMMDGRI